MEPAYGISYGYHAFFCHAESGIPVSTHVFQPIGNYTALMKDSQGHLYILDQTGSVVVVGSDGSTLRYHFEAFPHSPTFLPGEGGTLTVLGKPRSQKAAGDYAYSYSSTGSFLSKTALTPEMRRDIRRAAPPHATSVRFNGSTYSIQNWGIVSRVVSITSENGVS